MAVKRILVLKGSPREKGNTSLLADRAAQGARDAGAEVDVYDLHKMDIQPCDACDFCRGLGDGGCIVDDDMQMLYPKLQEAHGIIIASPVYWFTINAQTKLFIDRWYALQGDKGSALAGKQFGIIMAYADSDPYTSGAVNAIRAYQDMLRYIEAEIAGFVYGSAEDAGEILSQENVMEQAYRLGAKLGGTG